MPDEYSMQVWAVKFYHNRKPREVVEREVLAICVAHNKIIDSPQKAANYALGVATKRNLLGGYDRIHVDVSVDVSDEWETVINIPNPIR